MLSFDHIPLSELWSDYTQKTPLEGAISDVEKAFSNFDPKSDIISTSRFGLHNSYYLLNLVPNNIHMYSRPQEYLKLPRRSVDIIRSIFGLHKGAFAYVTNDQDEQKNSIQSKSVSVIFSVLRPAADSVGFAFPIFIQIAKSNYATFAGFSAPTNKCVQTCFSSRIDFRSNNPLSTLEKVKEEFMSSVCPSKEDTKDIVSSYRIQLKLDEVPFTGNTKYQYQCVKFYTFMSNDPIQRFYITCDFDNISDTNNLELIKATDVYVSTKRIISVYKEANTHLFMDLMSGTYQKNAWKELFKNGQIPATATSNAKDRINKLFADSASNSTIKSVNLNQKSILKAAPANSLLCNFVEIFAESTNYSAMAAIWTEFVRELRRRLDNKELIPGVAVNNIDFDYCIIYQKLVMLNICIQKLAKKGSKDENENEDDSDAENEENDLNVNSDTKYLLGGELMVYPGKQSAPVKTEDQTFEMILLLEKNADDQRQKAILQSDPLKADMSAFKVANPTAKFEDFVYWYSESDFDPVSKTLSKRMAAENNVWRELWDNAKPISMKQALFDPVAQSELVLDYFESMSPPELIGDLIPIILATIFFDVSNNAKTEIVEYEKSLKTIEEQINLFHKEVEESPENLTFQEYVKKSSSIFMAIEEAMHPIHCVNSLYIKSNGNINMINNLMKCGYHHVKEGVERESIGELLVSLGIDIKDPPIKYINGKHFVVSISPEEKNGRLQHRLAVSNYKDTFIVATALQETI